MLFVFDGTTTSDKLSRILPAYAKFAAPLPSSPSVMIYDTVIKD
jgi:hypothetical protein